MSTPISGAGPRLAEPLGVHTGWNRRHPDIGADHERIVLRGMTVWFPTSLLEDRFDDLAGYLARVEPVVDDLIAQGFVRAADRWGEAALGRQ
ncbi:MAG: hypothetical protein GY745_22760 [Actinomycetia bacterium]|nr:hypothetical protein [Actinomycetes bacterium]MCP4087840.1 hypothetical protein [Actinomycetes bacterium]